MKWRDSRSCCGAVAVALPSWIVLVATCFGCFTTMATLAKGRQIRAADTPTSDPTNKLGMPRFAETIPNITVTLGKDALLGCVVDNLKNYKVAWVRVDTQTILSIHHNVISQNSRISLTYNDHRSWYLHIREVEETDRGWYMCQVNTDPMRSRKGYIQIVVPPSISETHTSNDMVVREGTNVTLTCKASGYPEPYVMWRREDGDEMAIGGENVNVVDGELLQITKVSRLHMAAYLCVASNGVPPSISKRVQLRVQFPPMLSIPNQLEGAYQGQDVTLECHTEAYPASINYWTTDKGDMIISDASRAGDKFETSSTNTGYSKYMKLKIRHVGPGDFGSYRCVAKNSLGETDGLIKLDEIPAPTTIMTTETYGNRSHGGRRPHKRPDTQPLGDYGVEEWRDGDYNGDYILPSRGPPPMRHPPGAYHNSASSTSRSAGAASRSISPALVVCLAGLLLYLAHCGPGVRRADELISITDHRPPETRAGDSIHMFMIVVWRTIRRWAPNDTMCLGGRWLVGLCATSGVCRLTTTPTIAQASAGSSESDGAAGKAASPRPKTNISTHMTMTTAPSLRR